MLVEALIIEIVGAILYDSGTQGLRSIFTASSGRRAIEATAHDFPNIPVVDVALTIWCKSDDFVSHLESLQSDYDEQTDDQIIDSFIAKGGFFDGLTNTHTSARRVLRAFFQHLEEELYQTDLGPIIEARRAKHRHRATQAALNDVSQQIQQLPATVEEAVHKAVSQYIPKFNAESDPVVQEKIYFATIDLALELLKEGKAKSARRKLEDLRTKLVSEKPSVDLQFRLAANLGSCALQLDDFKTAAEEYETAIGLKPEHSLVLAYAALASMLTGDTNRALDYAGRARSIDNRDPQIASSYLRVLHHANRDDEIEQLLGDEEWIERDPKCALALGLIRLNQQRYDLAEAYFRNSLQDEFGNPHVLRLLAQAIVLPIDKLLQTDPPLRLSEETLNRIAEAENHLTQAVDIFGQYENPSGLYEALLQRAYVRDLQGKTYGALADCDRLLATYPNDARVLFQKGHTLLSAEKTDEALQCFSKIESEDERRASMISIALAYHRSQQHDRVIEILVPNWSPAEQTRRQLTIADLLLNAYNKSGDSERLGALIGDLDRERAYDPDALAVIARHHMRLGEKEEALNRYTKALEYAVTDNQLARIREDLAEYYFEVSDWTTASRFYKEIVDQTNDNSQMRKYLLSLYNSGARRAALQLAQELRGSGPAIPIVSEIEARVLIAAGKPEDALKLFSQLTQLEPRKISHKLWMVEAQRLLKNYEGAAESLQKITLEDIKNDITALLHVAQFRQQLGVGGDLPFAYRARRVGLNDATVHHAYVQLFMDHTRRESGDLNVKCVDVDFAVHLNSKGEKKTYLIVDQQEHDVHQGEIPPTDARAVEMLGKCIGDTVVFNPGRVDEVEYEIEDIQSKYVYAFQQTIIRHTEWFGGNDAMMVMDVRDRDLSKLFRMIDLHQERQQKTAELYDERRLPLATVARLRGANLFETWAAIVNSNDMRLHMTTGDLVALQRSIDEMKVGDTVVVEMSGFLTLSYLGLLEKLPHAFNRIVVAQTVPDKLEEWLNEAENQAPYMTIHGEQGRYFRQEITEEIIARRKDFIGTIKSFVEQHVEILPAVKALDIPTEQLEQYEDVLGVSAASLFVASECQLPLYMDDVGLEQVAASCEWQVRGVSTLAVLAKMKSRGLISAIEHSQALKTMILANYVHIHVTAQQLWWMCKSEGNEATPLMKRILQRTMQGPEWEEASAIQVAAQFTFKMWLEVVDPDHRWQLLDSVIEALISGREASRVKALFKSELLKTFTYLKQALRPIYARIDAFDQSAEDLKENAESVSMS